MSRDYSSAGGLGTGFRAPWSAPEWRYTDDEVLDMDLCNWCLNRLTREELDAPVWREEEPGEGEYRIINHRLCAGCREEAND